MRVTRAFLAVSLFVLIGTAAYAQPAPVPEPGPGAPPRAGFRAGMSVVSIGPKDNEGPVRTVNAGKMRVVCRLPMNMLPNAIDIYVDGKNAGGAQKRNVMFSLQYDGSSLSEGEHVFKAIGKDASGKEIWNASTKVMVGAAKEGQENQQSGLTPEPPVNPVTPGQERSRAPLPDEKPVVKVNPGPNSSGIELDGELKNEAKGFSIRYPAKWIAKDLTSRMKPAVQGGWWIALNSTPKTKSPMVVNIRRRQLEAGSTADTFAKYEPYVLDWERRTVLGAPAFATTSGTPGSKNVIHRLILIKDSVAWMFNLTDETGKPVIESGALFQAMINSLRIAEPPVKVHPGP